jgi:hypothetical protein
MAVLKTRGVMPSFGLIIVAYLFVAHAAPAVINLGGMFAPIDATGAMSLSQAEHLAAFVMAINEINDKTDGVYDTILPSTTLSFAVRGGPTYATAMGGFLDLEQSFSGDGVVSVVNALPTADALLVNQVSKQQKVAQVVSVANSANLYVYANYPYVTRTVAIQSFESVVLSNLLCTYFKAHKVVTIAATQDEDSIAQQQFKQLAACTFDYLAELTVTRDQTKFSTEISTAMATGARYFILFMPPKQLAPFLEQGHEAGLFHENTVVLASSRGSDNIVGSFSPGADLSVVMRGFFSLAYWPDYWMNRTSETKGFAERWRAQPSTAGRTVNGKLACDETVDDDGSFYLYRSQKSSVTNASIVCTGLNFASYSESGLDIQPLTGMTYDGVMLMALALDVAINHDLDYTDPTVLFNLQISNVSYSGASGPIKLMPGAAATSWNSRGGRKGGNYYNMTNFNLEEYKAGRNPMVSIGSFSGDAKTFSYCTVDGYSCFAAEFSSAVAGDYSIPPSDTPPPIIQLMSEGMAAAQYTLGAITGLLVLFFLVFLITHRRMKLIKSSQPALLYSILCGGLIAAVRVIVGGTVKNDGLCMTEFWTGHLAFVLIIASLYVKSYRVHRIVNTKTLRRVKFSAADAFKMVLVIVVFTIVFLIISSVFGQPHLHHQSSVVANQETIQAYCAMHQAQYQTALFAMEFVLLGTAFWTCWETRNVPDIVNESKVISTGTILWLNIPG